MRYTATLTFDYKDARSAEAVEAALSVDAELSASVQRESRVDGASVVAAAEERPSCKRHGGMRIVHRASPRPQKRGP